MLASEQLDIISKAWDSWEGYCFFPWLPGDAVDNSQRKWHEEGAAFKWPKDRTKILEHMERHRNDDLYWCPSLFDAPERRARSAINEGALWADLDERDPRGISDFPPSIAWETSPRRYQALWILREDGLGASDPGAENQRLTHYVGADPSGWDTTQLLRIPGWTNHKPSYRELYDKPPVGRLLWDHSDKVTYVLEDFTDLPDIPNVVSVDESVFEREILGIDPYRVWARIELRVTRRARELREATETHGRDRSKTLYELSCELARQACTVAEIVSVIKGTVWNKHAGQGDELRRLVTVALRAIAEQEERGQVAPTLEAKPKPRKLYDQIRNVPTPNWLIQGVLTEGACGFIAGQPKSFKSWIALDMAISVATGAPFLDYFRINNAGPVLYIQAEDAITTVKKRVFKIRPDKRVDRIISDGPEIFWEPAEKGIGDPPIDALIGQEFSIRDKGWQLWLKDLIAENSYRLVILDPLMMMAGDVEENSAQKMTEYIFKPLKEIAHNRDHPCALMVVHHMRKENTGNVKGPSASRGGQTLLGSVANHAWAEDSLYIKAGKKGQIIVEQESKFAPVTGFTVENLANSEWKPIVKQEREDPQPTGNGVVISAVKPQTRRKAVKLPVLSKVETAMMELGEDGLYTATVIAAKAGITTSGVHRQLNRLLEDGKVLKKGNTWCLRRK